MVKSIFAPQPPVTFEPTGATSQDRYQGGLIEMSTALLSGTADAPAIDFGRATGTNDAAAKYDKAFWTVMIYSKDASGTAISPSESERFLQLKTTVGRDGKPEWLPGHSPAEALLAIRDNPDRWKFDCAEFVQVVQLYSVLRSVGVEKFNDRIRNEFKSTFQIRPERSTGLRIAEAWQIESPGQFRHFSERNKRGKVAQGDWRVLLNRATTGSEVVFTNPLDTDGTAWRNEHAIKLGPDLYLAHGVSRQPVSRREIVEKMTQEHIRHERRQGRNADRIETATKIHVSAVIRYGVK